MAVAINLISRRVKGLYIFLFSLLLLTLVPYVSLMVPLVSSGFKSAGFYSLGGVLGGYIAYLIMGKTTPAYKRDYLESLTLAAPLMYGLGKIGCAFGGCCGGRTIHGKVFPIQKVEAICFIVVFLVSCYLRYKEVYKVHVAIIVYTMLKFVLDFFRFTHDVKMISVNQLVCAIIVCIAIMSYKIKSAKMEVRNGSE